MKIKLLLFLSILATAFTYAQTNERIAAITQACNRSSLIIEGVVVSKDSAFQASNGVVYTPYNVTVTSTIFGQASSNIQILMQGGDIVTKEGLQLSTETLHSYYLLMNHSSIIFCKNANITGHPNAYILEDQVCFSSTNEVIKTNSLSRHYSEINVMLKDMSDVLKIKIPQKKSPEINEKENKEELNPDTTSYLENVKNYNDFITQSELKKKKASPAPAYRATSNALTISTGNEQMTFDGTSKYFEFDIFVKAAANGVYFDNCLMRIQYNSAAFGSSLVLNGGVTITKAGAFNTTAYMNPQSNIIDQTTNTLGVPFSSAYQPVYNRIELTTTEQPFLHLKIKVKNCGQNADIKFVDASFTSSFSFHTPASNTPLGTVNSFSTTDYISPAANILCSVIVDDFNTPINGGKGEILTITGKNFGTTRGNGQVKFRDADNGDANFPYIQKLDDTDYLSWSDTEIKIVVPYMVKSIADEPAPGSGNFIVKNNMGDSSVVTKNASLQPLVIHYSLRQSYDATSNKKFKCNLANKNGIGGYTIRLDTSISNYPIRKGCVIKAINDWKCKTGINLTLGKDTALNSSIPDNVTTIYFTNTITGSTIAATTPASTFCSAGTNSIKTTHSFDIGVSTSYKYFYDTTGLPIPKGEYDFYEIMLHEIGHGIGHGHIIDDTQVMYWTPAFSSTANVPSASRRKLVINSGDVDGILHLVSASPLEVFGQCANFTSHLAVPKCNGLGTDELFKNKYSFSLYPNPISSEKLNLEFDAPVNSKINITVLDSYGRTLYNSTINNRASESTLYTFDMNSYASGLYFINLNIDGNNTSQKVIKY